MNEMSGVRADIVLRSWIEENICSCKHSECGGGSGRGDGNICYKHSILLSSISYHHRYFEDEMISVSSWRRMITGEHSGKLILNDNNVFVGCDGKSVSSILTKHDTQLFLELSSILFCMSMNKVKNLCKLRNKVRLYILICLCNHGNYHLIKKNFSELPYIEKHKKLFDNCAYVAGKASSHLCVNFISKYIGNKAYDLALDGYNSFHPMPVEDLSPMENVYIFYSRSSIYHKSAQRASLIPETDDWTNCRTFIRMLMSCCVFGMFLMMIGSC